MFPNVEAEMARRKITRSDLAKLLSVTNNTLTRKLNGESELSLPECLQIKNILQVEKELKNYILDLYGSLNKFADIIDMPWTTLDGVLKRGVNKSNITSLIKICEGLNIDCESLYYGRLLPKQSLLKTAPLTQNEQDLIKRYRALDDFGKKNVNSIINNEFERCNSTALNDSLYISKPYYSTGASAGTGNYLSDDLDCSTITIPDTTKNKKADFVLSVNGDSMLPTFENGDKVLVKKQEAINVGEIGIFVINNESYIKELGNGKLISHNKEYEDIDLNEFDYVVCIGKVLGKL